MVYLEGTCDCLCLSATTHSNPSGLGLFTMPSHEPYLVRDRSILTPDPGPQGVVEQGTAFQNPREIVNLV
ncbi:hypothetical protein A0H81_12158 [Grifola frondosa]|uniref:Uncharacterized protein n=1 Tax=Grifola frondosa TaxID=5627 RepID=A0A1C7LXY5_GRIFR|nr:hypothetical protein A0H81_12158 [Grifola frondosa]